MNFFSFLIIFCTEARIARIETYFDTYFFSYAPRHLFWNCSCVSLIWANESRFIDASNFGVPGRIPLYKLYSRIENTSDYEVNLIFKMYSNSRGHKEFKTYFRTEIPKEKRYFESLEDIEINDTFLTVNGILMI